MGTMWINTLLCVIVVLVWSIHVCQSQDVVYHIDEERPNGTVVGNIASDSGLLAAIGETDSASLRFSFITTGNEYSQYFLVNEINSELVTNGTLDREVICEYKLPCALDVKVAAQSALGSFFRVSKVTIFLDDVNDHSPEFGDKSLDLAISESVLVGTSFAINGATDRDTSPDYSLKTYELQTYDLPVSQPLPFSIHFVKHLDGSSVIKLYVTEPLDRETRGKYNLEIVAKDGDKPPKISRLPIFITILDVNDHAPVFSSQSFNATVNEENKVGSLVIKMTATDADSAENGEIHYRLSRHQSGEIFQLFQLEEVSGEITLKGPVVYSPGRVYQIIVEAYDMPLDGQSLTSQAFVIVTVENTGNNAPEIHINRLSSTDRAQASEYANIGTVVAYVTIVDHDIGIQGRTQCILDARSTDFDLKPMDDNNAYKIVVAQQLDFEKTPTQNVSVHCQDNGKPPLSTSAWFLVDILDENDHPPIFAKQFYSATIPENAAIGDFVIEVSVTDLDMGINADVYFMVSDEYTDCFYFEGHTGINGSKSDNLRVNKRLDREAKSAYVFPVFAIDRGSPAQTGTATISIHLLDINDHTPNFTQTFFNFSVPENVPSGASGGRVTALDNDLGINQQIVFSLHPEDMGNVPFEVLEDGLVKTNQELDRESRSRYSFRVIATDKGVPPLSSVTNVIVTVSDDNDNDPIIRYPKYPNNTAKVYDTAPVWQIVTKVVADDYDEMGTKNSRLRYSINSRNDSNLFQMNPTSGEIKITKQLSSADIGKIFRLDIFVSDFGKPERSAVSPLYINIQSINGTAGPGKSDDTLSNTNFLIAIIVGVVTVVISVAIIATIILLRKIDQQKNEKFMKKINNNPNNEHKDVFDGSITVFSLPSEDSLLGERKKKEVSFSLEEDVFSDDDLMQNNSLDQPKHFKPPMLSYLSPAPRKVEDNHSETSGDTGTSDSGRGGSDEEIHHSFTQAQSPREKYPDITRQLPPMQHQEIIPFSFKKGMCIPLTDVNRPLSTHSDRPRSVHGERPISVHGDRSMVPPHPGDRTVTLQERTMSHKGDRNRVEPILHSNLDRAHYLHSDLERSHLDRSLHNDLGRSQNKVVLLQTDSGIHSDTNSSEEEPPVNMARDCMV